MKNIKSLTLVSLRLVWDFEALQPPIDAWGTCVIDWATAQCAMVNTMCTKHIMHNTYAWATCIIGEPHTQCAQHWTQYALCAIHCKPHNVHNIGNVHKPHSRRKMENVQKAHNAQYVHNRAMCTRCTNTIFNAQCNTSDGFVLWTCATHAIDCDF